MAPAAAGLCRYHGDRVRGTWTPGRVAAAGEGPCACGLEGGSGPAAGQCPQLPGMWPVGGAWASGVGQGSLSTGWGGLNTSFSPHTGPRRSSHKPPLLTYPWGSFLLKRTPNSSTLCSRPDGAWPWPPVSLSCHSAPAPPGLVTHFQSTLCVPVSVVGPGDTPRTT